MKKFYQTVSVSVTDDNDYALLLDGKIVQTPARKQLRINALPLAEAIAEEWRSQSDVVLPDTMPLSQMAMTLIDRVVPNRDVLTEEVLGYLDTDLVCYRAAEPQQYRDAQEEKWNPFVDWAASVYGEQLQTTTGLSPLTQSEGLHKKIADDISAMAMSEFMALYLTTLGTGSLVMALASVAGAFPPLQILEAAFAEEKLKDKIYLGEIYGSAPDQERRYKLLSKDLNTLQRLLMLSGAN